MPERRSFHRGVRRPAGDAVTQRARRRRLTGTVGVACALLGLAGCPDLEFPAGAGTVGGGRVCTSDELIAFRQASTAESRDDLWIAVMDVGHGDAIWIRTPGQRDGSAREILVDAGDDGTISGIDGASAAHAFMTEYEFPPGSRLDLFLVSNADFDHYGGALSFLDGPLAYKVQDYVDPGLELPDKPTYQRLLSAVTALEAQGSLTVHRPARTGLPPLFGTLGDGRVRYDLFSANENAETVNDSSVVMRLEYAGVRVLLTGDAENPTLDALAADSTRDLRAQVLKVAHHGSADSSSTAFLQRVFPPDTTTERYALVSAGGRAALPAESTLERLYAAVGLDRLYRTDRGDAGKPVSATPGDDHILVRISVDGQLTVCHTEPDV
jgi:beta-lactamase superfamily II metal-dependent hydrolase